MYINILHSELFKTVLLEATYVLQVSPTWQKDHYILPHECALAKNLTVSAKNYPGLWYGVG
jgi:hypothetical protein